MDSIAVIVVLYLAGIVLIVAEVFVPSHGLLTIASLTCFGVAIWQTFAYTTTGGAIALIGCIMLVPTVLLLGIKNVHRLPMAKWIAPPNPQATGNAIPSDHGNCTAYIGKTGTTITALRPVGMCEFDGQRVPSVAESGILDSGQRVVGIDVKLNNLVVRPAKTT
ncbi:MAG: hypothetical protein H6817_03130 [Phycisphaerales bacterium]|nr:hypothetical protein [Phycisphaerales bacterium]